MESRLKLALIVLIVLLFKGSDRILHYIAVRIKLTKLPDNTSLQVKAKDQGYSRAYQGGLCTRDLIGFKLDDSIAFGKMGF